MIAPPVAALALSIVPGFTLIGFAVAAPVLLSAVILVVTGIETRDRALEELTDFTPASVDGDLVVDRGVA